MKRNPPDPPIRNTENGITPSTINTQPSTNCMYTADKQDKFVELRAQGWSLNHIAAEIYVAKRTLVEWSRELAAEIQNLRAQLQEMAQEKFLTSHEDEL